MEDFDVLILNRKEIALLSVLVSAAAEPNSIGIWTMLQLTAEELGAETAGSLSDKLKRCTDTVNSAALLEDIANRFTGENNL